MIDHKVIEMIKHHEGVKQKPYQCPALLWTVGVGHVIDPNHAKVPLAERKTLPIPAGWDRILSGDEIDEILAKDLASSRQLTLDESLPKEILAPANADLKKVFSRL